MDAYAIVRVQIRQARRLWPIISLFTEGIFGQDRAIVEAEQRAYGDQGADLNNEVFPIIQSLKTLLARRGVPLEPTDS